MDNVSQGVSSTISGASLPARHTAGPWEVRFRFGRLTTVSGRQRFPICDTGTAPLGEANHRREEANARLIAAAPDLVEACQAIIRMYDGDTAPGDLTPITLARAAIAKALGPSQNTSERLVRPGDELKEGTGSSVAGAEVAASSGVKSDSAEGH